jgi:lipopolysaccharide export system protein LptA
MKRRLWLWVLPAALTVATPVAAEGLLPAAPVPLSSPADGVGQSKNQPVQIDAKSLVVHDKSKTATFTGNVKVVQGDTTITCRTLVVFYGQELGIGGGGAPVTPASTTGAVPNAQNIRRIEARGDVTVLSKDQSATGDLGVYDLLTKTITLTGNVVVSQGKNVIRGGRLIVNTVTGNAHIEPDPELPRGRVRALIIPTKDNSGGGSNFMTIGPGPRR